MIARVWDAVNDPMMGAIIGFLLVTPLANKFGKKKILAVTLLEQGIGLFIVYAALFINMTQIMIGHWIYGIFNCGFPICLAMVADCVDYWEDKTGVRQDGSYYATYGLSTKWKKIKYAANECFLLHLRKNVNLTA